jgi:hypothetical protein
MSSSCTFVTVGHRRLALSVADGGAGHWAIFA